MSVHGLIFICCACTSLKVEYKSLKSIPIKGIYPIVTINMLLLQSQVGARITFAPRCASLRSKPNGFWFLPHQWPWPNLQLFPSLPLIIPILWIPSPLPGVLCWDARLPRPSPSPGMGGYQQARLWLSFIHSSPARLSHGQSVRDPLQAVPPPVLAHSSFCYIHVLGKRAWKAQF